MKLLKKLQILFLLASLIVIYRFLATNLDIIIFENFHFAYLDLFWAAIFSLFSYLFLATKLSVLYDTELAHIRFKHLFKTISRTNLYRYLPGGVWNHAGLAIDAAEESGKSIKTTSKLQVLNIFFMVYTGALFLFFVLPSPLNWLLVLAFIVSTLLINQWFSFINSLWQKFGFKQKLHLTMIAPKLLGNILLNNWLFWFFNGLSFVYFLKGLGLVVNLELGELIYLSSSYILAWLAGFLFLPAPAGVGVREAVLGFFLNQAGMTLALGVSISLLYRLFILARDLAVFAVSLFVRD